MRVGLIGPSYVLAASGGQEVGTGLSQVVLEGTPDCSTTAHQQVAVTSETSPRRARLTEDHRVFPSLVGEGGASAGDVPAAPAGSHPGPGSREGVGHQFRTD